MGRSLSHPRVLRSAGPAHGRARRAGDGREGRPLRRRRAQPHRTRHALRAQLGLPRRFPFLHFEACYYRAIDFAIERGLKRVEAGARASTRSSAATCRRRPTAPTGSGSRLRPAVEDFLARERRALADEMESSSEDAVAVQMRGGVAPKKEGRLRGLSLFVRAGAERLRSRPAPAPSAPGRAAAPR